MVFWVFACLSGWFEDGMGWMDGVGDNFFLFGVHAALVTLVLGIPIMFLPRRVVRGRQRLWWW